MNAMRQVRDDEPLMIAWKEYLASEEYQNDFRWAADEAHRTGALWSAFAVGFGASPVARVPDREDICLLIERMSPAEGDLGMPVGTEVEALADAILALFTASPSDGWQPIETAPKDGTAILAWVVHPNAKYGGTIAERSDWQGPVVARWIDHNGGGWAWHGHMGEFKAWQPLPNPPSSGQDVGGGR